MQSLPRHHCGFPNDAIKGEPMGRIRIAVQMWGNLMLSLSVKTECGVIIMFLKCKIELKVSLPYAVSALLLSKAHW